ncbi:bifunctional RNase H/acid phosphatase [Corynebacterium casei]|uniref:bifunctional RNase H/acid phosphatase n=1 Tax=Corynebacterium casei TaxID=160386 RepID=UPI003F91AA91
MKVIIYADGGSRGNPGTAGSGTVIYAADGKTILDEIVYVVGKKSTNNVAEYYGLLRGVERAAELGATEVEFFMDSKLVVEQINGRWKIKHPDMQKLAVEARKYINTFDSFSLAWVARAKNSVADKLSNDAMDACAAGHPVGIVRGISKSVALEEQDDEAVAEPAETTAGSSTSLQPQDWMGDRGDVTRFVLLRHGQTQMSVDKQYSGHTDIELTERGQKQALAAAQAIANRGIEFDVIVSSPLKRCQQTAQAAAQALGIDEVETVEDLIELDFGKWEGESFDEVGKRDSDRLQEWMTDSSVSCPDGESLQQLHKRVRKVRKELQERYAGKTLLVVTHVNPIKSFIRQALDGNAAVFEKVFLGVASISDVEFWSEGSLVRCVNDVGHLGALE